MKVFFGRPGAAATAPWSGICMLSKTYETQSHCSTLASVRHLAVSGGVE